MATLYDYVKWRGDLSYSASAFNEIDAIIFAMLSYIDFDSLSGGESISLREAAMDYCSDGNYDSVDMGLIVPSPKINRLFCEAAKTKRFGNCYVGDYVARTSDREGHQFAAVTFHIDSKHMVVSFRGTDDTIVGWKEDCCLAFMDEIPAQRMAVEYINAMAAKYPEQRIYVTGHSKGGNLTLYASLKCHEEVGRRIVRAYCNDGPGLSRSMIASQRYKLMQNRLTVLLPQSSIVGILFEKGEKYTVVKSVGKVISRKSPDETKEFSFRIVQFSQKDISHDDSSGIDERISRLALLDLKLHQRIECSAGRFLTDLAP